MMPEPDQQTASEKLAKENQDTPLDSPPAFNSDQISLTTDQSPQIERTTTLPQGYEALPLEVGELVLRLSKDATWDLEKLLQAHSKNIAIPSTDFLASYYKKYRYIPEVSDLCLNKTGNFDQQRGADWSHNIAFLLASMEHFPPANQRAQLAQALANITPSSRSVLLELLNQFIKNKVNLAAFYEIAKLAPRVFNFRPVAQGILPETFDDFVENISKLPNDRLEEAALLMANLARVKESEQNAILETFKAGQLEAAKEQLVTSITDNHPGNSNATYAKLTDLYASGLDSKTRPLFADALISYSAIDQIGRELWSKTDLELRREVSEWLAQRPEQRLDEPSRRKFLAITRELYYRETDTWLSSSEMLGILMLYHSKTWERAKGAPPKFLAGYVNYNDRTSSMLALFAAYTVAISAVSRVDIVVGSDSAARNEEPLHSSFFNALHLQSDNLNNSHKDPLPRIRFITIDALNQTTNDGARQIDNREALVLINGRNCSFFKQVFRERRAHNPNNHPLLARAMEFMLRYKRSTADYFLDQHNQHNYLDLPAIRTILDQAQRALDRATSPAFDQNFSSYQYHEAGLDALGFLIGEEERAYRSFVNSNPEFNDLPERLIKLCLKAAREILPSYSKLGSWTNCQNNISLEIVHPSALITSYLGAVYLDDGDSAINHQFALEHAFAESNFESHLLPGGAEKLPFESSTVIVDNTEDKLSVIIKMAKVFMSRYDRRLLIITGGLEEYIALQFKLVANQIRFASTVFLNAAYTTTSPEERILLVKASDVYEESQEITRDLGDLSNTTFVNCSRLSSRELVGRLGQPVEVIDLTSVSGLEFSNQNRQFGPPDIFKQIYKATTSIGYNQILESSIGFARSAREIFFDAHNSIRLRSILIIQTTLREYELSIKLPVGAISFQIDLVISIFNKLKIRAFEDLRGDPNSLAKAADETLDYLDPATYPELELLRREFLIHFRFKIEDIRARVDKYEEQNSLSGEEQHEGAHLADRGTIFDNTQHDARHGYQSEDEYHADRDLLLLFDWHQRRMLSHHLAFKAITRDVVLEYLTSDGETRDRALGS